VEEDERGEEHESVTVAAAPSCTVSFYPAQHDRGEYSTVSSSALGRV
jgi:hypothetical protein